MITWLDLLIGLLPFTFIAFLLWIRLCAAGASTKVAVKFVAKVFVLVAVAMFGLVSVTKGWHEGNSWLLTLGGIVTIVSILILRISLQRMWEKFPLSSNGSKKDEGDSH